MAHTTLHPPPWPQPADVLRRAWSRLRRVPVWVGPIPAGPAFSDDRGLREFGLSRDEVRNLLRNLKG